MKVVTTTGKIVTVKIIKKGKQYGRSKTTTAPENLIEFYDKDWMVQRYNQETLLNDWITGEPSTDGLNLFGSSTDYIISAEEMNRLRAVWRASSKSIPPKKEESKTEFINRLKTMAMHYKVAIDNGLVEDYPRPVIETLAENINTYKSGWIDCLNWLREAGLKELENTKNFSQINQGN